MIKTYRITVGPLNSKKEYIYTIEAHNKDQARRAFRFDTRTKGMVIKEIKPIKVNNEPDQAVKED
jgi:hypothetical protein